MASGLPVGPEGPLIHIGAALGSAISQGHSTTMKVRAPPLIHITLGSAISQGHSTTMKVREKGVGRGAGEECGGGLF